MWCSLCGAPLSLKALDCAECGAHAAPTDGGGPPQTTAAEPCADGRRMAGLSVEDTGATERVAGTTTCGMPTSGEQRIYEAHGPGGLHLWLGDVRWEDGEREVRRTRRYDSPRWLDRLLGRQRLAVDGWGEGYASVELTQARSRPDGGLMEVAAGEYELDAGAGTCVRCALQTAGALSMGTRQEVLGVRDERRHIQCVTFPVEAERVPVIAFLLVRVLPLFAETRGEGLRPAAPDAASHRPRW